MASIELMAITGYISGIKGISMAMFCSRVFTCSHDIDVSLYCLSYEVASGSEITPCNKINKPLVDYIFSGMTL